MPGEYQRAHDRAHAEGRHEYPICLAVSCDGFRCNQRQRNLEVIGRRENYDHDDRCRCQYGVFPHVG
jgi:hypothetical protein